MDVTLKKIAEADGHERFVLVHPETREVLTTRPASAAAVRRFFAARGVSEPLIERCLERARDLYHAAHRNADSDDSDDVTDLLLELGFSQEDEQTD